MINGDLLGNPSAHGPAGEIYLPEPDGVEKSDDDIGLVLDGICGVMRFFGLSEAKQVRSIDSVSSFYEMRSEVREVFRTAAETMDQDYGFSVDRPAHIVMNAMTVDKNLITFDAFDSQSQFLYLPKDPSGVRVQD